MDDIEKAIKVLVDAGFEVTGPEHKTVYLVDHGHGQTITTRKTLKPSKNQFSKISAHRVALIHLDELKWIDFPEQDLRTKDSK